jgi:hypothetical protein
MISQSAKGMRGHLIKHPKRCDSVFRVFGEPDPTTGKRSYRDYDIETDVLEIEITSDHHHLVRPEIREPIKARVIDSKSKDVYPSEPRPQPQIMEYQGYRAVVRVDLEECILCGKVFNTQRPIHFEAKTVAGLMQAFHDAVENHLEWCEESGWRPDLTRTNESCT